MLRLEKWERLFPLRHSPFSPTTPCLVSLSLNIYHYATFSVYVLFCVCGCVLVFNDDRHWIVIVVQKHLNSDNDDGLWNVIVYRRFVFVWVNCNNDGAAPRVAFCPLHILSRSLSCYRALHFNWFQYFDLFCSQFAYRKCENIYFL